LAALIAAYGGGFRLRIRLSFNYLVNVYKKLTNVYINKIQMVLTHYNSIIVSNVAKI